MSFSHSARTQNVPFSNDLMCTICPFSECPPAPFSGCGKPYMKKAWVLSYPLSGQWGLGSDWADAKADLSLPWVHRSFCCFFHDKAHVLFQADIDEASSDIHGRFIFYNRLGTLADLAIVVHSSYDSHFEQTKSTGKSKFSVVTFSYTF